MAQAARSAATRYGSAVLSIVVATLLRFWLDSLLEGAGFAVFFVAVVITAWFGGLGPSLLALGLSLLASAWLFRPPPGTGPEPAARVLFGIAAFFFVGVSTALLSESMRAAQRRAQAQADEAVKQREQLRITLACIGDAVIVSDRDGRLTMMNRIAESLTGWTADEATGLPVGTVFCVRDEQTGESLENPISWVLSDGVAATRSTESILTAKDGSERPIHDTVAPIRDDSGNVMGFVLSFRDVTDQRRTERALRDADRRKDEFLAILAHELRNPLAPICTALEILRAPVAPAQAMDHARAMMDRQVQHLVRLVDDLLDVSRIMRGKIELRKETIELRSVLARAVETAQPIIEARQHELILSLPVEPIFLEVDPIRLAQVVANLLTNAAKYTEPGGRIWLTGELQDSLAVIRVRDSGIGIPAQMLPLVFELFTQVDSSVSRSQGGLGIGLTLVKNLVELNGGTVEAHSGGPGLGSEFIVRLPAGGQPNAAAPTDGNAAARVQRPVKHRILVVDDNSDAADTLAMLLRIDGHEVKVVHDGPAALQSATEHPPEIVFLDIGMPRMDGFEVARRMRQLPRTETTLLVALTGWGLEEDRRRTRDAGFDCHLVKPVGREAINRLLAGETRSN